MPPGTLLIRPRPRSPSCRFVAFGSSGHTRCLYAHSPALPRTPGTASCAPFPAFALRAADARAVERRGLRSPRSGTRSPRPRRWPRPARPRRLLRPPRSAAADPLRAAPAPWTLRRRGPGAAPTGNWPGASPLARPRDLRSRSRGMGLSPAAERRGRLRLFRFRGCHRKPTSRTAGRGPNDNQLLLDMQLCPSVGVAGMGTVPTEQRCPGLELPGSFSRYQLAVRPPEKSPRLPSRLLLLDVCWLCPMPGKRNE